MSTEQSDIEEDMDNRVKPEFRPTSFPLYADVDDYDFQMEEIGKTLGAHLSHIMRNDHNIGFDMPDYRWIAIGAILHLLNKTIEESRNTISEECNECGTDPTVKLKSFNMSLESIIWRYGYRKQGGTDES